MVLYLLPHCQYKLILKINQYWIGALLILIRLLIEINFTKQISYDFL